MLERIEKDKPLLVVDKQIKSVHDQSITWLWNAYNVVNNQTLMKKVCTVDLPHVTSNNQIISPLRCVAYVGGTYYMKALHPLIPKRDSVS